jgi:LuxR family maltose regulon positive regulatory protein
VAVTSTLASELELLESKLRPPSRRPGLVPRRSLVRRLSAAAAGRVVVEAPAGYGKTTVLGEWARDERRRLGWFTADGFDDDPIALLAYLAAMLGAAGADVEPAVERLAREGASAEPVVDELVRALEALDEPAAIVLDDLHRLADPDCAVILSTLVEHVPAHSLVVLVVRARTDLPHDGAEVALTCDDLRLSDLEAGALLRANGVDLADADVSSLNARCRGWATGVHLAGLAIRDDGGLRGDARLGAGRHVVDFFRLEVLDGLPAEERELLLEASVVARVSGELCDAMTGRSKSGGRLASLARANAFIAPVEGEPGWFELHPLFRETLHAELERRHGGLNKALLARASDWFEDRGDTEAAIECAIGAEDGNRVAALCARVLLHAYRSGRHADIERWCASVDDVRLLARYPAVAFFGSALHALGGRPEAAERWARVLFQTQKRVLMPDGSRAEAWAANLRAQLCTRSVETMCEDAELALAKLAKGSDLAAGSSTLLGFAALLMGDEDRAAEAFLAAVDGAVAVGAAVAASTALAALSLIGAAHGRAHESDDHARRAQEVVAAHGLDEHVTSAYVYAACARAALLRGQRSIVERNVERADRLVGGLTWSLPWLAAPARLELVELHLGLGNPARARELLDELDEILAHRPSLGVVQGRAARLRHDLDAGRSTSGDWASLLTAAELRLLPLLAGHLSFREIAERLSISRNTVKTQAIAVYRKLNVSSRSQAVARARELGILGLEDHPNRTMH